MRVLLALLLATSASAAPRTFRVDYFHTGNASEERFSLDRLVVEPLDWPGNPARPVDETNLGKYLFEVRDSATNRLLYSRGFASIYGEWETTAEAKDVHRTFHESLRFPAPSQPIQVLLKKRDARNAFREVWSLPVDPQDMFVDPSPPASPGALLPLLENGPPSEKVDLLILGDGYTAQERPKFEKDARRMVDILFTFSPFKERKADFNVWGLVPPAAQSGISRPSTGIHRRSPVSATYDAFGSERYILTFDNKAFREAAAFAPYDFVEILVNGNTYGGGGIFGLYGTVAADSLWSPYIFVHEFGHHFAGLADEYYTSDSAYLPAEDRPEPWEKNVTALKDPTQLKWKALLSPSTPVPTPWDKPAYEAHAQQIQQRRKKIRSDKRPESEMDALFTAQRDWEEKFLGAQKQARKVGAFEGAMYEARGYYRPQVDCVMFTRDRVPFCAVCQHALTEVIDLYSEKPAKSEVPAR
ncbi:IgA peptidase. Metallo peptidase. MEROPS family M64 [Stigmatella aurantiaca]|uniref:IgA peptidase. Metallo peptidase. MEROPS family M64 n=1 Tax=Stigmatella aurantiaca TaxID=41 RepID=A0A1H7WL73_STIAU|nr:IgA Peptidase M64 [Stigmatella aurantiaca]SEM22392.1 IgA peptidase. Metallo peptidase. MEROPS family M64 [Stigmatella aurantiaca]